MEYQLGDRVCSTVGMDGGTHHGVISKVTMSQNGPLYHVRRDSDGFTYLAYEEWLAPVSNEPLFNSARLSYDPQAMIMKASTPSSPRHGDSYYDPDSGQVRIFVNGSWVAMGTTNLESPELSPDERRYLRESLGLDPEVEL